MEPGLGWRHWWGWRWRPWRRRRPVWFAYAPNTGVIFGYDLLEPPVPTDLTLGVEYGCDVPLWGIPWESLGLSDQLLADLRNWQDLFDTTFDPFAENGGTAWVAVKPRWAANQESLSQRLRSELPPDIPLVVSAWPEQETGDPGQQDQ